MFCPKCGFDNRETVRFCANCGSSLANQPPGTGQSYPGPRIMPQQPAQSYPPSTPQYPVPYQQSAPQYPAPYPNYAAYPKNRSTAILLELLLGIFGFLGIGWMYSDKVNNGLVLMFLMFFWDFVVGVAAVLTVGVACVCTLPLNLLFAALSTAMLNSYTKTRPDLFGP